MPALGLALGLPYGRSATTPAWTPLVLAPMIWLDATQLGLSDGDPVAQFTDYSGNNRHFVQAATANKPTFRANGINSKAAVESDGVDDAMTLAAYGAQATWWGFIVTRILSVVGTNDVIWALNDYNPDANYLLMEMNGANQLRLRSQTAASSPTLAAATNTNYAFLLKGSAAVGSITGDKLTTVSTSATDFSRPNEASRIFNRGDSAPPANVRIGELIHGSGVLTGAQETALWTYANTKWGTSIP